MMLAINRCILIASALGVLALGRTFRNICSGENLSHCVDRVSELLASPLLKESFEYVNETQITCRTFGGVPMVACELLNELSMRTLTAGYSYVSECLDDSEGSEKECPNFDEFRNEVATPGLRVFEGYGSTPMGMYINSLRQGFEGYVGALNPDPYRVISDTERITRDTADHVRHMVWSTNHFLWMHSADMARNLSQDTPFYHFRRDLGMRWDTAISLLEEMAVHRGPNLAVVEIGVFSGHFSDFVLGALPNVTLIGIDPYYGDDGTFPPELAHLDPVMVYEQTKERYSKYGERAKLWATTSKEASRVIPDESIDLIFIDGCHEYDCVREDIDLWLPKLRPGGIMSGHDFSDKWPGVVRRVNEIRAGQDLFLGMDFMWWWMKEGTPFTAEVANSLRQAVATNGSLYQSPRVGPSSALSAHFIEVLDSNSNLLREEFDARLARLEKIIHNLDQKHSACFNDLSEKVTKCSDLCRSASRATSTIDSRLATVAAAAEDVQSDIEGLEDRVRMRVEEATSRAQEITDRSISRMAELARGVQEGIDALLQTRGVQDEERDGSYRAAERRLMELEKLQKDTAIQVSALKSRAKKTDEAVIEVERKWGARLDEHSKHIQGKLSSSVQRLRSPLYELVDTVRTKVEEVEHKTEGEARRVEADLTTLIQAEISKRSSELPCRPRVVSVVAVLTATPLLALLAPMS
ncbi:hypothetical protein FOZ62_025257 [Perkinsus olseni]|uniref:Uncharacterized protein n=1 Tax=Perkinsus olseni TaxID=32597 RepID=A0A7J6N5P4_PEROL|nr:hypothetical protein FOZ62_025257 [Perkinsus olseni]